jgi:DNA-binding MarR family transcriptional regulator
MTVSKTDPHDSLVFLTNRVGRLLSNEVRKKLEEEEGPQALQPTHIGVLVDLWAQDGVRQQDLAVSTIKDKGTITRTLNFLEQENLVVRVTDRSDKRNKRIYLTHKGKELEHQLLPYTQRAMVGATSGISQEELCICKDVLVKLYKNLIK